ncbi:MAG TPA: NifU family protein [Acidimicrobiales bacterium]
MTDLAAVGDRIAALVDAARASPDPRAGERAEELVVLITDLYGVGVARIVELVEQEDPRLVERLAADELVGSLLRVHGLHPDGLVARVEGALESVRPLLASHGGDVELLDVDPDVPAVRLRLLGSCNGCPSSASTLRYAVEEAIVTAAPEVVLIDVEDPGEVGEASTASSAGSSVPVELIPRPRYEECPAEVGGR